MGIFQSPNNSAIMGTAPPDKLGVVSGMLALTRTLGQSTGIAIIGAIWAALTLNHPESFQVASATGICLTKHIHFYRQHHPGCVGTGALGLDQRAADESGHSKPGRRAEDRWLSKSLAD